MSDTPELKRSINLPFLIFYGVGTMVGAGFFALMGKIAGEAGMYAPIAFLTSALLAFVSAFSFAELSARLPFSAGESRYVQEGFNRVWLSGLAGWLVISTGVVSAATISTAFVGFLQDLVPVPEIPVLIVLVIVLGCIAAWGISESVWFANIITVLTIAGLVYVVVLSGDSLLDIPDRMPELIPPFSGSAWSGILAGGFLGFYAFIGFEDLVNNAEEIKDVRRNLPIAIFACLGLTLFFYLLVTLVAVLSVSPRDLAESNTPLALVVQGGGWFSQVGIGLVSLIAGVNGALVQIIMSSRVAYGMAGDGKAPQWLRQVHPRTRTPLQATALMTGIVLLLALFFPLVTLAKMTSTIMMIVFALVNLALWRIKKTNPDPDGPGPRFPRWLPLIGFLACVAVLLSRVWVLFTGTA